MNQALQGAQARPHLQPAFAPRGAAGASRLRLMLADDCRANRMLVSAVLMRWCIVPTMACNGEEAVRLAGQRDFDLVLMDILMPVMDGAVATARIRQFEREHPARAGPASA